MKKKDEFNAEFFEALALLEKEKGIESGYLLEKIRAAIVIAVKHDFGAEDNVEVVMDPETNQFTVTLLKDVVEEVENPGTQITLEDAQAVSKKAKLDTVVRIPLQTKQFGRIAAITAKHVIRQGIREAERGQQLQEFQRHSQDLVTVKVSRVDPVTGNATVEIGRSEAVLIKGEQMPGEVIREGAYVKIYVADVREGERGPRVLISRTHPGLVKRLFEMEVPEIFNGVVEIKAISREAGSRTKMAVSSNDENVDAVGACIGPRHSRVDSIAEELGGEKIDIVEYSEDPATFIAAALSPAKVVSVTPDADGAKACRVTVPDAQLSLAIGNKGQNARLAAKLTGWKIDIRPESGFFGEEEPAAEED